MTEMDYEKLGLKVGLEIHQQLDTKKLFCDCTSKLVDEEGKEVIRELKPTASEMGEVDAAALLEAQKGLRFRYQSPDNSSCLVELDEEPPEGPNKKALKLAFKIALMFNAKIMDEIHFMRKIVIDGSNTTGFQRTGLIALDGNLKMDGKNIGIPTICLEEDAARSIEKKKDEKTYRLDRLGIPLIEIATDPDIKSPEEAKEVAQEIGGLLRATRQVKRGLGTIREDLNVSIKEGARVEIKGVQDLSMLPEYVTNEVERQVRLLNISKKLKERGAEIKNDMKDVTKLFKETECSIIKNNLDSGKSVFALKLCGFDGLLRGEEGEPLLGPELAEYAKKTGVAGIFHSDELPKFGINEEEMKSVEKELKVDVKDAFVLVTESERRSTEALEKVKERAEMALEGVPEETRNAQLDGTTSFSRPLSGKARMYPETDVPPYYVENRFLDKIVKDLPERPSERIDRFQKEYDLNEQQSRQLFKKGYDIVFEDLVDRFGHPSVVANTFLHTYPELEKEGYNTEVITEKNLIEVFDRFDKGEFAKEGIVEILKKMSEGKDIETAIQETGLETIDGDDLKNIINELLDERIDFVEERGMSAVGPLMGVIMKEIRGKADGEKVSKILREELQKRIN